MTYNLSRIVEVCKEHVDNNFRPLPAVFHERYVEISGKVVELCGNRVRRLQTEVLTESICCAADVKK